MKQRILNLIYNFLELVGVILLCVIPVSKNGDVFQTIDKVNLTYVPVSLTRVESNKVLRAKKSLSFVNLTYNTLRMIAFGFLVYSTFLPLKTALHLKCVFFSGFLVRLRVDI